MVVINGEFACSYMLQKKWEDEYGSRRAPTTPPAEPTPAPAKQAPQPVGRDAEEGVKSIESGRGHRTRFEGKNQY